MVERSCLENRRGASHRGFESHPLRHVALLISALVLAGCNGLIVSGTARPEQRYLQVALPRVAEGLQVADLTGTVIGAEVDVREPPIGNLEDTLLVPVPGRANAVVIGWPGGCEQRVDIAVQPPSEPGNRPTLTLKLLPGPELCPVVLPRRVIVLFDQPVQALLFNFDVVQ